MNELPREDSVRENVVSATNGVADASGDGAPENGIAVYRPGNGPFGDVPCAPAADAGNIAAAISAPPPRTIPPTAAGHPQDPG